MPIEWVVAGLVTIIGALSTGIGILWRNHLAGDERERKRADVAEADNRAIFIELRKIFGKGASK